MEAAENHKAVLENIKDVNNKINQLSAGIKQEIEGSNKILGEKIDNSANEAEKSCEALKQNIEAVNKGLLGLVDQVSKLPSKDENQKIVDEAMAKTIEKFEKCIASNVEVLDKKTEEKLVIIKQQLIDGFDKIDNQQEDQAKKIQNLADQVSSVFDEREKNIKALTALVDSTMLSNKALLEKFGSIENDFAKTQEAFKKSDKKYSELLDEKAKDWNRLVETISEQIKGFETINTKLLQMDSKINAIDQRTNAVEEKIDNQCQKQEEALKVCAQQVQETCHNAISLFKKELVRTQEEAAKKEQEAVLREEALRQEIKALKEGQTKQNEKVDALRDDLRTNAEKVHEDQNKILTAINSRNRAENKRKKITSGDSTGLGSIGQNSNSILKLKNKQHHLDQIQLQQQFAQGSLSAIDWSNHTDQNNKL